METLSWNWLKQTQGNLTGLSRSDHGVSLSKWTHNLNWMYLRHLYGVQDVIWTSYVCSIYCNTSAIPLFHKNPKLQDGMLENYISESNVVIFNKTFEYVNKYCELPIFTINKTPANTFPKSMGYSKIHASVSVELLLSRK